MNNEIIGQILGIIAVCITSYAISHKDDKKLKNISVIGGFFWVANFWFLAAYTSFAISLLILIRQFITTLVHDKSVKVKSILTIIFVILNIIVGYYTYTNIISIFPIMAGIIATISMFMFKNEKLRFSLLLCELCWFINNIFYINIGGLIANILNVSIHIKNILHFKKEAKKENILL